MSNHIRKQFGTAEITILITISLLGFIATLKSEQFLLHSLLHTDQLHTSLSRIESQNQVMEQLSTLSLPLAPQVECLTNNSSIGRITRDMSLCYKSSLDKLYKFNQIFANAQECPKRVRKSKIAPPINLRSFYECDFQQTEILNSSVFAGDFIAQFPLNIKSSGSSALLASKGSMQINSLTLSSDTNIVSLGDMQINMIRNFSGKSVHLTLITPLGNLNIKQIDPNISISLQALKSSIPKTALILPIKDSALLPTSSILILGIFPKPFRLTP